MPDCKTCKENRQNVEPVPYIVHESAMARQERNNKRWFIAWLITFILLVGCVAGFVWYENQWEVVETEITQDIDTGIGDAFVSGTGDVIYGESAADSTDENTNP